VGLYFTYVCFLSPRYIRAPSADRRKTLTDNGKCVQFVTYVLTFGEPSAKITGAKTCKILVAS